MRLKHVAVLMFAVCALDSISAEPPTLSAPTLVDGQLQFTLTCESNAPYRIEASTNLQAWFPVATNLEAGTIRQIHVPMLGARTVYRALARTPLFNFALLAAQTIDLNVNDIIIDSFDSGDPNFSTFGDYDPLKRRDRGDVAYNDRLTATGVAAIYGTVLTTSTGLVNIGPAGKVGDLSWHADETKAGFQDAPKSGER